MPSLNYFQYHLLFFYTNNMLPSPKAQVHSRQGFSFPLTFYFSNFLTLHPMFSARWKLENNTQPDSLRLHSFSNLHSMKYIEMLSEIHLSPPSL